MYEIALGFKIHTMKYLIYSLVLSASLLSCSQDSQKLSGAPFADNPDFVTTNPIVHDPVLAKENGVYYLFATGRGISVMQSTDLSSWRMMHPCLDRLPSWLTSRFPEATIHLWAPDIYYHNGLWHLLYSSSAFGKNTSFIAHLTSPSLSNPVWTDCGPLVQSVPNRDMWNAIDPNIVADTDGTHWLVFGSFWDGIMLTRLSPDLMSLSEPQEWHRIVHRHRTESLPTDEPGDGAVEAPFIFHHGKYFYLFVSFDYCCRGKESTYKVVVGRSERLTGPYLDRDGVSLEQGGGSLVVQGDGVKWQAVGHSAAYTVDGRDIFLSHAYDVERGAPHLFLTDIQWQDDWPVVTLQ